MSISIIVSNRLTFDFKGEHRDDTGAMKPISFTLTALRMKGTELAELQAMRGEQGPSIVDKLCDLVVDWKDVKGEGGFIEFSQERLRELFDVYPGLPAQVWTRYLQEVAVRAKN
jgi:hypothetical protein